MVKARLTDKKIEEVVRSVCGDDVLPVIRKLRGKENISEFKLAEQLKLDIKRVRNILYRLYDSNLVEFTRKKDKKKGWYIYYWTFKSDRIGFLHQRMRKEKLYQLKHRLERETGEQFFICPNKCVRMNFEQAVAFEYRCPECGELTTQEDTRGSLEEVRKEVVELEKEIRREHLT